VKTALLSVLILGLLQAVASADDADHCAVCGVFFTDKVYIFTDKVTNEKTRICSDCSLLDDVCFVCGLPVKKDFTKLADGRCICARDAKNAVLNEDEAKQVYEQVHYDLDRLFSRFMNLPITNISTTIVDRVNLLELFKVPGNDYSCPNVLGYISSKTNRAGKIRHKMSLLGALPRAEFKAVCAHELTHAWQAENVPLRRKKTLGHDACEGFCELVAYKFMESQSETDEMKAIRRNVYTRGQIDLFIDADQRFGFDQVVDWMKYGVDSVLHAEDLNNVRNIEIPRPTVRPVANLPASQPRPEQTYDTLTLKGILWSQAHPMATINNHTFEVGDTSKVKLGLTNVTVLCVGIREDAVRIKVGGSDEVQELRLRRK
jgi:hypothetical protein